MEKINQILEMIKTGNNEQLELVLKNNPAVAEQKTDNGISLLQFAAYCRNDFAVALFRKYKCQIDIYEAASVGDIVVLKNKLERQPALLNTYSADGFTPLGLASYFGHYDVVKILLEKGADPDLVSKNQFKVAPIHSACAASGYEIAKILIEFKADVNAKQMQGVTPLHSAAHNGNKQLVQLLIESGASLNSIMDNGQTPLSLAIEKGYNETADILRKYLQG
jgi:ankyrin repeat protein